MYSKHRKPLRRSSFSLSDKNKTNQESKQITESSDSSSASMEDMMIGMMGILPGFMALAGGDVDQEEMHKKAEEMNDTISTMMNTMTAFLDDLGLSAANQYAIINTKKIHDLVFSMGRRTTLKNRQELYNLLTTAYDMDVAFYSFKSPDDIDEKESVAIDTSDIIPEETHSEDNKDFICVAGMAKDDNNEWEVINDETIPITAHDPSEGLYCPVCETVYHSMTRIMFAPTISLASSTVRLSERPEHVIKHTFPHMIVTPVCPKCYCDRREELILKDEKALLNNVSHIMNGCDLEKRLVPLVPACYAEKMKDPKKNDTFKVYDGVLYFPKNLKDSICQEVIDADADNTDS